MNVIVPHRQLVNSINLKFLIQWFKICCEINIKYRINEGGDIN